VLTWLSDILKTGGATEITPGATRSARVAPRPRLAFSWSAVPVALDGNVCIQKGVALQLVRAPSSLVERVVVIDAETSERGEAQWEAGSDTVAWPPNLAQRPDVAYSIAVGDGPPRRLTLRVLTTLPVDVIAWPR
jgi:hypothetical protein